MSRATLILLCLAAGLLIGVGAAALIPWAAAGAVFVARPVGTLWLNALKMTVIPLVVALLVVGIARSAEAAQAGRIAGRSVLWIVII